MQSFLIVSKDKQKQKEYLADFFTQEKLQAFDIVRVKEEGAIGIDHIRTIQKALFLKPLGDKKAIVIYNAQNATLQAQNALLKMLEEPPSHTIIILTAAKKESLIPTIQSRCQIIELAKEEENDATLVPELQSLSIAEKLVLAEKVGKSKDTALLWVEDAIRMYRDRLRTKPSHASLTAITFLQKAYTTVQTTNVSPRLVLEHLFLSLIG